MEQYPRTAIEFESQFGAEDAHLDYYLDEFTFRFNRRTSASRGKLFYRLLEQAVAVAPVSDAQVLASRSPVGDHNM